ncbi:MAG: class I SAM-dependent methyltransferase [Actinomycetia bacterium]|nr:class I SAM-dependent methyltransferase [Actinomycetes bacterium]
MARHNHPLFTRIYGWIARVEDAGAIGRARTQVCGELSGRVLIIGLGPGVDLHHLPPEVTEVVAVEPSVSMRKSAEPEIAAARARGVSVELLDAVGEELPLPDNSVDGVLMAFVLCTIADDRAAIAEARRVLRPNGVLAVLEHVRAADDSWMGRSQRFLSPIWPYVAGGCHCDRDTRSMLDQAGFDTASVTDTVLVNMMPTGTAIVGVARPFANRG